MLDIHCVLLIFSGFSSFHIADLVLRKVCLKIMAGELLNGMLVFGAETAKDRSTLAGCQFSWLISEDIPVSEARGVLHSC